MAEDGMVFKGESAQPGAAAPVPTAAGTGTSPLAAKSITDYLAILPSGSQLSKEGEAYIERVRDAVDKNGRKVEVVAINGSNYESRCLIVNDWMAVYIFHETYMPGTSALPDAAMYDDVLKRAVARGITAKAVSCFVVAKEDYAKVDVMATRMANLFTALERPELQQISLQQFNGSNYHITTDLDMVTRYAEQMNPLAVLPRCNCGILVYTTTKETNVFQTGRVNQDAVIEPMIAVTAYTEAVRPGELNSMINTDKRYTLQTVITGVYTKLNTVPMFVVGLTLAAHVLIKNNRWLQQFSTFGKGSPDLGNLFEDANGKLCRCKDIDDRNAILMTMETNGQYKFVTSPTPVLAFDVQLGAATIPGARDLFGDQAALNKAIDDFTGGNAAQSAAAALGNEISQLTDLRYDGVVQMAGATGAKVDTRCIDYLTLLAEGAQPGNVDGFTKIYPNHPEIRAAQVKEVYKNAADLRYITYRSYMRPEWVEAISNAVASVLHVTIEGTAEVNAYNMGVLKTLSPLAYGMGGGFVQPSGGGGAFNGLWRF